jgi:spoIIIJ-associated protein
MKTFEFEAKTTEEAIDTACRELDVSRDEIDIEILEPGSAGIFGLVGGRKARIRVSVGKMEPESVEEGNEITVAKETLEGILALIPTATTVRAESQDGKIVLNIDGDKSGLLIGRKGRTLDALQFIVNKIVNKTAEKKVRVIIDSENYRQRRRESLIQMALKIGDKAKRIGKPVTTNPLNPHDRRIVHLALRDDEQLDTTSRGEGMMKKVLIIPKK